MKKKAIKLAAASAVAASAFVASAPAQTNAATNVAAEVSKAVTQMKKAYHTYSDVTATGKFADIKVVYKEYNAAKAAYNNAKALVNKAGGSKKDAYLAQLDSTYADYITKRVVTYIDAYNYATKLADKKEALEKAIADKDLVAAEKYYNEISYELNKRTVILDRVYGQTTRELLRKEFKTPAQDVRDSLKYDITVVVKLRAADEAIKKGDLTTAADALKVANDNLSKVTETFKAQLTAKYTEVNAAYEAALTPKVESVSAINAKQIQIKFNKAVDKASVIANETTGDLVSGAVSVRRTVTAGDDSDVSTVTGTLSEDRKTLTLTASGTTYFKGTYAVTVNDIVTANGEKVQAYATTVNVDDKVAPTVTSVVYNPNNNKFEINLSEPVTVASIANTTFRINGTPVTLDTITSASSKLTATRPSDVALGTNATVYLAGAQDAAGNIMTAFNGTVQVTKDTTALQPVSVKQVSSNVVRIAFNKAIAGATEADQENAVKAGLVISKASGAPIPAADITVERNETVDKDNKTFDVTIANLYGTNSTQGINLTLVKDAITDVTGNKNDVYTTSVTMTKDVTGPTVVSTKVAADKKAIEITLNEDVTVADVSKVVIRKDGVALSGPLTSNEVTVKADDPKVLVVKPLAADVNADGTLKSGAYSVRLEAGAISDVDNNLNSAYTTAPVTVSTNTSDLTATIGNATTTDAGDNSFEVTFSEAVTAASALDYRNYKLDGETIPSGSDLYFKAGSDNKVVVIKLPATDSVNVGNTTTGTNARLSVSGVVTSTGKTVVPTSGNVTVKDNTAARLTSATLIAPNVIKLTFNENITASFDDVADILDNIQISNGTTTFAAGDATETTSVSGKDLIITITPGTSNWSAVTSSPTVTVKTLGTGDADIQDVNGVTVKGDVSVTLTK